MEDIDDDYDYDAPYCDYCADEGVLVDEDGQKMYCPYCYDNFGGVLPICCYDVFLRVEENEDEQIFK